MSGHRVTVGAPSTMPAMRSRGLLRQLAEPSRHRAFPRDTTPHRPVLRAGRGLVLVLRRRTVLRGRRRATESVASLRTFALALRVEHRKHCTTGTRHLGGHMALASLLAGFVEGESADSDRGVRRQPRRARPTRRRRSIIRSPDAVARVLTRPGELGIARAYVAGDIDIEGDIFAAVGVRCRSPTTFGSTVGCSPACCASPASAACGRCRRRRRRRGCAAAATRSTRRGADRAPLRRSNDFYRLVLGTSMTYSCAVFDRPDDRARRRAGRTSTS